MQKKLRHIPPYDFQYRFEVSKEFAGKPLIDFYTTRFHFKPREYWLELIASDAVSVNHEARPPDSLLAEGDTIRTWRRDVQEPPVNDDIEILCHEDGLFALNKKAPIPVHPSGRYFRNSLTTILREKFPATNFHTIHRLDLWTTGVLLLATTPLMAKILHGQVEKQKIKKSYGVLAVGDFGQIPFTIDESIGRIQGAFRGTGTTAQNAKVAVTHFTPLLQKPIRLHGENTTLSFLKAEPITGRTNQIRVHTTTAGGYILHDPIYSPHAGKNSDPPFLGLHCREMAFIVTAARPMTITAPWPEGFLEYFSREELDDCFEKKITL